MKLVNGRQFFTLDGLAETDNSECSKLFSDKLLQPVQEKRMCKKHGEYISDVIHFEDGREAWVTDCPQCIAEREEEERKDQEKRERKRILAQCKESNIEPEFYFKKLEDFIPQTESQKKALEASRKLIYGDLKKVVLLGPNGVGKTMLASIVTRELCGKIYSMYEISAMIRDTYTAKAKKSELDIVYELASIPFLAIDEMGRSSGSNSEMNWLSFILDKRHTRKLPFILISNRHLMRNCKNGGCSDCFENFIGNDCLSRLYEDSAVITIDAKDNRRFKYIKEVVE